MKIIFIFCFSYIFCEVLFLEKYEQTLSVSTSGCICLDVSEFDVDDTIHMHFSSHNGGIEDGIYYGFTNIDEPTDKLCNEITVKREESSTHSYSFVVTTKGTSTTSGYNFNFKKTENAKYMLMKYYDFNGLYLEIENIMADWGSIMLYSIFSIIGFIILVIIIYKVKNCFMG